MLIVSSRRKIIKNLLITICGIAAGVIINNIPDNATFGNKTNFKIVLDAGHGLPDGGAVGAGGTIEQEINLSVAKKICEILKGKNISVIMTRDDENCLSDTTQNKSIRQMKVEDMRKRLEIIKSSDADLFLSIHMNFFENSNIEGLRMFYNKNFPDTKVLCEDMQKEISKITKAKTYAVKPAEDTLFLIKNSPIPTVLAECGFISNPKEEKNLNDEEYQSKIAWAIVNSLERYINGVI